MTDVKCKHSPTPPRKNRGVIKTFENLEADEYCDKYVFQDWLEKVSKNNDKYFYLDEGPGIEFEIREE